MSGLCDSSDTRPALDRTGPLVRDEEAQQDTRPADELRGTVAALRHLEHAVTHTDGMAGLVLRYGVFYGPGTSLDVRPDGEMAATIREGRLPLVGGGTGVWSFVHVADAATATALVVEKGEPGIYHVTDDEPAPAAALGAGPPRRVPAWLVRLAAGEVAVTQMTEARGASNRRARTELGWESSHASWREGFPAESQAGGSTPVVLVGVAVVEGHHVCSGWRCGYHPPPPRFRAEA